MGNRHLCRIAILATLGASLPGAAGATLISDTTKNVSYAGAGPTNWFAGGTTSVGDVIEGGNDFDTQKVDVSTAPKSLHLEFYTQFDGDDLGAHYADIFIASDPAHPDSFDYAIALGGQLPYGGVAKGFYAISNNYQTSIDRWKNTGYIYGGQYISPNDSLGHNAPVVVTGGSALPGWTVDVTQSASGDGTYPYLLSVTLTAMNNNILKTAFSGASTALLWGTGDCNNDSVYLANVPPPPKVPEPPALALFMSALVAFAAANLRRRSAAPAVMRLPRNG